MSNATSDSSNSNKITINDQPSDDSIPFSKTRISRRQAIGILAGAAVAVAAVGAGVYYSAPPAGPTTTTQPTTAAGKVRILGFTGALGDALIPVINAFQAKTGVSVDYTRLGYDELAEKGASLMTVKDTSFDIICQDDSFTPKVYEEGWFEPWENFGWTRDPDLFDGCIDLGTWPTPEYMGPVPPGARQKSPKQYAIGWGGGPTVNYVIRTDKLQELGMGEPKTWDDVEAIAKAANNPSQPFYGWVNRGAKGDPISFDTFPIFFDYGLESIFDSTWHVIANRPEGVAALQSILPSPSMVHRV